jgi:hypothetical protein
MARHECVINGRPAVWADETDQGWMVNVDEALADHYMHAVEPFLVKDDFAALRWVDLLGHIVEDAGTMP